MQFQGLHNAFKAIKTDFLSNKHERQSRYIHIDGSPYGSTGLARLNSSVFIASALSAAAMYATQLITLGPTDTFKVILCMDLLVGGTTIHDFVRTEPPFKRAVIDTTGQMPNDDRLSSGLAELYRDYVKKFLPATAAFGGVAPAALFAIFGYFPAIQSAYTLFEIGWKWHAAHQLECGKWTASVQIPKKYPRMAAQPALVPAF